MPYDFDPKLPIYLQMMDVIQERIFNGTYKATEAMPSVRDLAGEFSVNPNTVQRAFRELEDTGLVITRSTTGRTVTDDSELIGKAKSKRSSKIIGKMLAELDKIGVRKDEIMSLVEKEISQ